MKKPTRREKETFDNLLKGVGDITTSAAKILTFALTYIPQLDHRAAVDFFAEVMRISKHKVDEMFKNKAKMSFVCLNRLCVALKVPAAVVIWKADRPKKMTNLLSVVDSLLKQAFPEHM